MNNQVTLLHVIFIISLSNAQFDGSFWWKNKDLVNGASQSRSLKDQTAKIRTLPPKYRHEDDSTSTTTIRSIFTDESEEDKANYKYDDEPDCVCVPKNLCNKNNILITDGAGLIDERSFNLCGSDNVCCKLDKSTTSTTGTPIPIKVSSTTPKNYFNFNINITNLISTILKPIQPPQQHNSTLIHHSAPYKCISKKGSKLQERILANINDDDEEEESELLGTSAFLEYPWMVELLRKNLQKKQFEYKCGAVLISSTAALTANHCLKSKIPSNFIIRAGEWDRSSTLEYIPHQDRVVTQIISHPNYYSGGLFNDVAILKFEAVKNEVNVQPLCLPEENEIIPRGTYCTVTAWGSVNASQASKTTDKLRYVKVPIMDREQCERKFKNTKLGSRFKLHESFLCAGGEEGLDSCTNDGGSPLICSNGESYSLHGLVSWGLGCGERGIPGVYTNIPHLLKWIKSNI